MPRKIETHFIPGPAGRLESLLKEPEAADPRYAALVCHPHPLYGGTMHNKVVYRMARGLRKTGAVVLRFNFRGVNLSEGEHAHGVGEIDDARAALDFLKARYPELPWMLAGFSFGSRVALRLGCSLQPSPQRVLAAGFPTRREDLAYLARAACLKCSSKARTTSMVRKPNWKPLSGLRRTQRAPLGRIQGPLFCRRARCL